MQLILFILIFPFLGLSENAQASQQSAITLSISKADLDEYQNFVKGRPAEEIDNFHGVYLREIVESILIQKALKLGGYDKPIKLQPVINYNHSLQLVSAGVIDISGISLWHYDAVKIDHDVYISRAIIEQGDYIVGFYTKANNNKALNASSLSEIQQLAAVSSRKWFTDWRTLRKLRVRTMLDTFPFANMVKAVHSGKGDFTLAPFSSNSDLSIEQDGFKLIPIPNIAMALNDSRHVTISNKHPESQLMLEALNKGLSQLNDDNKIHQALAQSGFYNTQTADWPVINL
ncbi:hypothetical protein HR060_01940 [Catenovulum sp. SM1970]|uniref:hypothetical protein n=1 Tax=Marinifaba aquimaris TaxID=2741323 RepID=UPI001574002D|nr:hypothetical protein [Marinifaba aquimaris]NTS75615.1 hypothetical protein [Marinifaba aquimaris]